MCFHNSCSYQEHGEPPGDQTGHQWTPGSSVCSNLISSNSHIVFSLCQTHRLTLSLLVSHLDLLTVATVSELFYANISVFQNEMCLYESLTSGIVSLNTCHFHPESMSKQFLVFTWITHALQHCIVTYTRKMFFIMQDDWGWVVWSSGCRATHSSDWLVVFCYSKLLMSPQAADATLY